MEKDKITTEMAANEFMAWCEANDIETDISLMNEDSEPVFTSAKNAFIKAMKTGRCVIDGLKVTYTISKFSPDGFKNTTVEFSRPSGNIWLGMDSNKNAGNMHKMQNAMSALTGKDVGFFSKLDAKEDWSFFMKAVSLFLS